MRLISVLGLPGAGKTTLTKTLSQHLSAKMVTAGDVARQLSMVDPEVENALSQGQLAPRSKMNAAMRATLDELLNQRTGNVIVDGYPRYMEQLADLWLIAKSADAFAVFVVLSSTKELSKARLLQRARSDDTEAAIENRIDTFYEETSEVIKWLNTRIKNAGLIHVPVGTPNEQAIYTIEALGFTSPS